jgi:hypothetical protein
MAGLLRFSTALLLSTAIRFAGQRAQRRAAADPRVGGTRGSEIILPARPTFAGFMLGGLVCPAIVARAATSARSPPSRRSPITPLGHAIATSLTSAGVARSDRLRFAGLFMATELA